MKKVKIPLLIGALSAVFFALAACDRKEKVLDVETPGGSVEVERDVDSGDVDVKVDKDE